MLPQINCNGDVVWIAYDGHDYEVFLYQRSTRTTIQLTDNDYTDWSPQINSNGDVVWQGQNGGDWEIFIGLGAIEVEIDIKPGSSQNSINLRSRGVVPVAVLTTASFDARSVLPSSVTFAGAPPVRSTMADVDRDGDLDRLFHFKTQQLIELNGDSTEATLTGKTDQGISINGTDTVNIVPKRCKKDNKDKKDKHPKKPKR
jgi:hypothetical protein